jgi:hypothetical protein
MFRRETLKNGANSRELAPFLAMARREESDKGRLSGPFETLTIGKKSDPDLESTRLPRAPREALKSATGSGKVSNAAEK